MKYVKKPPVRRKIQIRDPSPMEIESLRGALKTLFDKTLISVLAYGGLRPGEALALTWGDIGTTAIAVDKALSLGEEKETKNRKVRSVPVLRPLAHDLNEWRIACGSPTDDQLVFAASNGGLSGRSTHLQELEPPRLQAGRHCGRARKHPRL